MKSPLENLEKLHLILLDKYRKDGDADSFKYNLQIVNEEYEKIKRRQINKFLSGKMVEKKNKALFVTISFDDAFEPRLYIDILNKMLSKVWVLDYEYVIEQRSEEEGEYYGFHAHILITTPKPPSQALREIYASVKDIVQGQNFVDVKRVYDVDGIRKYMSGQKKQEKKGKVDNDNKMREFYGISHLYKK